MPPYRPGRLASSERRTKARKDATVNREEFQKVIFPITVYAALELEPRRTNFELLMDRAKKMDILVDKAVNPSGFTNEARDLFHHSQGVLYRLDYPFRKNQLLRTADAHGIRLNMGVNEIIYCFLELYSNLAFGADRSVELLTLPATTGFGRLLKWCHTTGTLCVDVELFPSGKSDIVLAENRYICAVRQ